MRYLKEYHRIKYTNFLTSGKLNSYLADTGKQAGVRLVVQMAECEVVTEQLKAADQMVWVGAMNNVWNRAE